MVPLTDFLVGVLIALGIYAILNRFVGKPDQRSELIRNEASGKAVEVSASP